MESFDVASNICSGPAEESFSEDSKSCPNGFSTMIRVHPRAAMHAAFTLAHTGGYTIGGSAR